MWIGEAGDNERKNAEENSGKNGESTGIKGLWRGKSKSRGKEKEKEDGKDIKGKGKRKDIWNREE